MQARLLSSLSCMNAVALVAATCLSASAVAGTSSKRVDVEAVPASAAPVAAATVVEGTQPAFQVLNNWVTQVVVVTQAGAVDSASPLRVVAWPAPTQAGTPFEPAPVIVGAPDLPAVGGSTTANWSGSLNYQGLNAQLLVLDSKGKKRDSKPLSAPLHAGERFKIRVTATFNAQASISELVGDVWAAQLIGQVYPQGNQSIQVQAGQTIDLPLGATECFIMPTDPRQRFVVSIKPALAQGLLRSNQPIYRQDTKTASNYLQLVPAGTSPAFEQVISPAKSR